MIPKSGYRFRKRSCSTNKIERDDDSKKSHLALAERRRRFSESARKEAIHLGSQAMLGELRKPHRMNSRVLVLVLDLIAAVLGTGGEGYLLAQNLRTARGCERIAQAAETGREIAGGLRAGREMLMKLLIRGREDDAVLPVDTHEVPIVLVPHQRKSAATDTHHMIAGAVAVRLLVG